MSMPLWNSRPAVHGELRVPNSELTAPRTGQRDGSAATALPARAISRSSAVSRCVCSFTASPRRVSSSTRQRPPGPQSGAGVPPADAAVLAAGRQLGAERLPDLRVQIAPARHLLADLGHA